MSMLSSIIAQSRRRFDPAITAFAAASGATDLQGLSNLAAYLRGQSLLSSSRCYPMKSAQNAGSGSTVYGWGDLTTNNCTLVNSPTWGVNGVAFDGSTQAGKIDDFTSAATLTVFGRVVATANTTALAAYWAQYDVVNNARSVVFGQRGDQTGDPLGMLRSTDGGTTNLESILDGTNGIGSDTCYSTQWISGGGRSLWVNKVDQSLTVSNSQTSRYNSSGKWTIAAAGDADTYYNARTAMTSKCILFVQAAITDTQRGAITDLINAL